MYYLIIYLSHQDTQHIKPPDSDQADATGKCTLEWIGAGEKKGSINNVYKFS